MAPLFASFSQYPYVVAALSERRHGTMTAGGSADVGPAAAKNRTAFFATLGIASERVVACAQVHGRTVAVVAGRDRGKALPATDGLIAAVPQVFLTVTVADCLPIFFLHPKRRIVGLVHAGWRSLARGIINEALGRLTDVFRVPSDTLLCGIGPGIGPCHFAVGPEVAAKFSAHPAALFRGAGASLLLDLKRVAAEQMVSCGVRRDRIEMHPDCTSCLPEIYFSYRRDQPSVVEAMVAVIGLR